MTYPHSLASSAYIHPPTRPGACHTHPSALPILVGRRADGCVAGRGPMESKKKPGGVLPGPGSEVTSVALHPRGTAGNRYGGEIVSDDIDVLENATSTGGESDVLAPPDPLAAPSADTPLRPSGDGQDPTTGRFVPGNRMGRGNPLARRANQLRVALYRECSAGDLSAVIRRLIDKARDGDVAAAKVLLERLLGPPVALDVATRIERLEVLLQERRP